MTDKLLLGLPSKGRIKDGAYEFFARAGLPIQKTGDERGYSGGMRGASGVEVLFLSAGEIASALVDGSIHLGVTGEDLMREACEDLEARIVLIKSLGFGGADVVVAVPESWMDVWTMRDLEEVSHDFRNRHNRPIRIATKYLATTRRFFLEQGVSDYRLVESAGATEGAPAAGSAEAIVDITSTGTTLAANNLKVLRDGVILRSQAQLAASRIADWSPTRKSTLSLILDMVSARERSEQLRIVRFQLPDVKGNSISELAARTGAYLVKEPAPDGEAHCSDDQLYGLVCALREEGATNVTVHAADYIFGTANPLYDAIAGKLS